MTTIDLIGFIAAFCTTSSFLPQAIKVLKTKDTSSLSLIMYAVFNIGVATWLIYGILKMDYAMIVANFITFIFTITILIVKIYNDYFQKPLPA